MNFPLGVRTRSMPASLLSVQSTIPIGGSGRTIWSRREQMDRIDESVHHPTGTPRDRGVESSMPTRSTASDQSSFGSSGRRL